MTPERQKWWDSLSQEEKRVRHDAQALRMQISWHKIGLKSSYGHETEMRKFALRMNKRIIKALRKQIAMQTIGNFDKCPCCSIRLIKYFPHCACCGQKLRW